MLPTSRLRTLIAGRAHWLPVLGVAVFSALFIARVAFVVDGEVFFSLFDDQMISMQYARNLVEGHGLVWNAGEPPVEGYTNLLWTLWMAVLHLFGPSPAKASLLVMLSGAVILVLNVVVVRRIVAEIAPESRLAGPVACWLVALDHSLAYWTLRGFEVGLVALEISVAVLLSLGFVRRPTRRGLVAIAIIMALGMLTRDDTLPAWLVLSGWLLLYSERRHRTRNGAFLLGAVAATLAAHTVARQLYYGAPLPNTYYLKLHAIPLGLRWQRGAVALARTALYCLPLPLALTASLMARRPRHPGVCLLVALFLAQCAYSVHVGGDVVEDELLVNRFLTCGLTSLLILAALGLESWSRSSESGPADGVGVSMSGAPARARSAWILAVWALCAVVAVWNARLLVLPGGAHDLQLARAGAAIAAASVFTVVARGRLLRRGAVIAGALVFTAQGPALLRWATSNAFLVDAYADAMTTKYALALRDATTPEARIAVAWAGAVPYFSQRRSVDLLGVCDATVARLPPRPGPHTPGHDKWDYGYSIGTLRPDVIASVIADDQELLARLQAWGYTRVGPETFLRSDSSTVDRRALERAACTVPWGSEDFWAHFGESPALWGERWQRECQSAGADR